MQNKEELSLYIHIPFCVRKCGYCDFLSAPADEKARDRYVQALLMEIERYRGTETADRKIKTLYIGGGTPSTLSVKQLECIMQKIKCTFNFHGDMETSMEMNPGTASKEKCRALYQMGINRLSIGLQSTNDMELKTLGRIHSYEDFLNTYTWCREAGFQNINVDLMAALPYQTVESYTTGLRKIIRLAPEHISAYSLILEEGTPFYQKYNSGCYPLPDEEQERLMYRETEQILAQAGYERYEISNYAKKGLECRHNKGYWQRTDYLGLGLGASSLVDHVRFSNTDNMEEYLRNSAFPEKIRCDRETLTEADEMAEFMFLGLRMTEGVSVREFEEYFGKNMESIYGEVLKKHFALGMLKKKNDRIFLTRRGIHVSNGVMADFLL